MKFRTRDFLTGSTAIITRPASAFKGRGLSDYAANRRRFKVTDAVPQMSAAQRIQQANDAATALILQQAQPMFQQMQSQAISGNNVVLGQTYNFNLTNVGLNRRIVVEITGNIAQAAAETLNATPFGIMNLISNVTLTDLSNYQRINTNGRHLFALATARRSGAFGAAFMNDSPVRMGSNMAINSAPPQVTVSRPFRMFIELPLAYHENDLRGSVWANVTGGQWRMSLTFNNAPIVGSATTDLSNAAYVSSTAGDVGVISGVNVIIHQDYLDQIPINPKTGQAILPVASLAYNYLILSTPQYGIVANTDFAVQYTNFRTFLSTMFEYNNGGVMNPGTDINYIGIQVANQVFLTKADPFAIGLATRNIIGDDYPPGFYYMDHRKKPIITNQYGNTQLVVNASTAAASSYLNVYWEMLSVQNQALNAGSLAAG